MAVRAILLQDAPQLQLFFFAGHLQQSQAGKAQYLGLNFIPDELLFQGFYNPFPMGRVFHINKINDNNAADVTQAQLAGYFHRCFQIGCQHCFRQVVAADVLAGVDIDGRQGFHLVYDQVAAAFKPHFAFQGLLHLVLHAVEVKEINALPQNNPLLQVGDPPGHDFKNPRISGPGIDQEPGDILCIDITQDT